MYNEIASNKRKSALLILVFLLVIIAVGWWAGYFFDTGPATVAFATLFAVMMSLASYYQGDKLALAVARARPVSREENPYVHRIVENLCIATGMPLPRIYEIPDGALNAFATGRDPAHASLALTTGIIEALEDEELEGVIAHELSHIKNYDIRLATVVIICVGIVTLVADWTLRSMFWGRQGRRGNGRGNAAAIMLIIGLVFAVLAPLFAKLIQLAVSRKREFLADASGALATRYPEGLARALEKIAASTTPLSSANRATAHLYLDDPFKKRSIMNRMGALFGTHPPLEERIKRLRAMA